MPVVKNAYVFIIIVILIQIPCYSKLSDEGYFTRRKSFEYGGNLYFNFQFEPDFGLRGIKYGLFPTFNFFVGNNFYIGPRLGLNHVIEKEILIFTESNPDDPYSPVAKYDTVFHTNISFDLGAGLGLAFGKNKTVTPFFESGFLLAFGTYKDYFYPGNEFKRRYYIIPFECGIKILIREFNCINIGVHNAVCFNRKRNENNSIRKELRILTGLKIGFSLLRY